MPDYTIYLGSDHRGFAKKQELVTTLSGCHPFLHIEDCGPAELDPDDDFNDAAIAVSKAVLGKDHSLGILLCSSAHGVTMQANRFQGIRAIHANTPESAKVGREHDHANVLCLSADDLASEELEPIIKAFCHARPDESPKYVRRVQRLDEPTDNAPTKCATAKHEPTGSDHVKHDTAKHEPTENNPIEYVAAHGSTGN